jgi:hypothetical protein
MAEYHYGPGGERLPDGQPRIVLDVSPRRFERVRLALRAAIHAWRYSKPTKG